MIVCMGAALWIGLSLRPMLHASVTVSIVAWKTLVTIVSWFLAIGLKVVVYICAGLEAILAICAYPTTFAIKSLFPPTKIET